jgi:ABC-type Fe3+/spermidine/putrescine transport system ATPase subunit
MNLQEAIRVIQRELGVTTIFVTHDLGEAMAMSDRMALLLNGEIVELDKPENLFHRPRSLAAAKFMGVSAFLSGDPLEVWNDAGFSSQKIFAIRPEHICIQKEKCVSSLPGIVSDCVFRGEYVEYQVAIRDTTVRARMPMPAAMFPHGEQVYVKFPSEHLFEVKN